MFARITLATALLVGSLSSTALADKLGAGDPAPALAVGKWVKGDPVASFEKGKVYVVEFWATWCKPCRESIPHLTELQKTWRDKGVTIIGVSVREADQSAVVPFVEKMADKMAYGVAMSTRPRTSSAVESTVPRTTSKDSP